MKKTIVANWKMYKTLSEALAFVEKLNKIVVDVKNEDRVIIAPSFTFLHPMNLIKKDFIKLAAQNMYFEKEGAFTGEISASMLKSVGATYVILGHSERRAIFQETDRLINKKVIKAISEGLTPIFCIGENFEDRENKRTEEILKSQLENGLKNVDMSKIIVAYEPVWAIGTGRVATSAIAKETHRFIKFVIKELSSEATAKNLSILYGGSVKSDNIKDLMDQEEINGALIGGASLDVDTFMKIINFRNLS